jgi:N-acetylglucosamine-6-phosphate deacetylase
MRRAFINGRVLLGDGFVTEHAILVGGDRIEAVAAPGCTIPADANVVDLRGQFLLPGFIDIQVNGGGGVLFNDEPTIDGIAAIGCAHRRFGTTGFLPTLISDDLVVVARAIAAVEAAIAAGVPGVLGIHIEGPFLSEARKGVHDASRFRSLGRDLVQLLSSLRGGRTLVTLAPEVTTPDLISQLTGAGVIVSAGHSNATYAEVEIARRHGLTGFTHLFNAMSPMSSREPGMVGAALSDDDSWCGIIVDGHHVDPVVLKIALRAKRHDRFMLVTDAMPCVGTNQRSFRMQGHTISVQDGYCVDEEGTLAGTALDMGRAIRNAVALLGLPPADAVRMASEYPARFLGLDAARGRIAPGCRADFVVADDELSVLETWTDGRPDGATGSER